MNLVSQFQREVDLTANVSVQDSIGIDYETITYTDPATGQEREGGVVHIATVDRDGTAIGTISLPSEATASDVEAIKSEIYNIPEARQILSALATAYSMRSLLILEGGTSLGKTYLVNKFNELLYGKDQHPMDFYCSGQTDVSELMAKWVPNTTNTSESARYERFVKTEAGKELVERLEGCMLADKNQRDTNEISALLGEIGRGAGLSEKTQWNFQLGLIPKAMTANDGAGCIVHIEEVGLAEPQIVNALLKIRGEHGRLTDSIQLWENGGRTIEAGSDFWAVMSTNTPEEYLQRNELDPALARGAIFLSLPEISPASINTAAQHVFSHTRLPEERRPTGRFRIDLPEYPEIAAELAGAVSAFHASFMNELKNGEPGRSQRIPLTFDDISRAASHLALHPVVDAGTKLPDLGKSLEQTLSLLYMGRLKSEEKINSMKGILTELLDGPTSKAELGGTLCTLRERLEHHVQEAWGVSSAEVLGDESTDGLVVIDDQDPGGAFLDTSGHGCCDHHDSRMG
jgi:hypothetical protein